MCEWGTETTLRLTTPAHLSHSGKAYERDWGVDSCIASLIEALNAGGVVTTQSCCGHGKRSGSILLADGRELLVLPSSALTEGEHIP